ncbi:MAG: glycosyltransferase family 4 protein [Nitrospiraceae bacterium]
MKILFVHGIGEIGGAERELLAYVDHLGAFGYAPVVACPEPSPLATELKQRGIPVHGAEFPPWRKLWSFPRRQPAVRLLRLLIGDLKPALVHVNDLWWVPQTLRALRTARVPVAAHLRQDLDVSKVAQYELARLDCVMAVSNQVAGTLEAGGVRRDRIHVLHSGLDGRWTDAQEEGDRSDVRRRLGMSDHAVVIGTVGNIFPRKGYDIMLRALPEILTAVPNVHYLVLGQGDGAHEQSLRRLCRELGLTARVHFLGFERQVRTLLDAMNLYVQPSLMEGFGIAVLEAMAREKAVVASRTGGLPDIVVNGETGWLVPPGDIGELARAVTTLLKDPDGRKEMGRKGRQRVMRQFTVEAMMNRLSAVYAGLVRGPVAPSSIGAPL